MDNTVRIDNEAFYAKLERKVAGIGLEPVGKIKNLDDEAISQDSRLSIGMECLDRDLWDYKPSLENLRKLGIKQARLQSGWAKTEKEKGVYDFSWLDEIVDILLLLKIKPWLCLCYGNPIYAPPETELRIGGLRHTPLDSEGSMAAWLAYVEQTVKRYSGKISVFEVWNEPECSIFFPYKEQWPGKYLELVKKTSTVIRATTPDVRIAACSASNFGISSHMGESVFKLGIAEFVEIYSCHGYRGLPEQMNEKSRRAYKLLVDKYAPDLEIWQGESGIPSYNAPTSFGALSNMKVSEEIQARWVARRVLCDLADTNLKLIAYFHLYDFTHFTHQHNYYYGVLRQEDYSRKPSYDVLQLLSVICDRNCRPDESAGMEVWPDDCESKLTATDALCCGNFAFKRGEHTLFTYWYPADVTEEFEVQKAKIGYWLGENKKFTNPVIIDTLSRRIYQMKKDEQGWIKDVPLCSYPMILCEYNAIKDFTDIDLVPEKTDHDTTEKRQIIGG